MSLIQDLKRDFQIHPIAIDPEGDKVMRMSTQTAKLESGSVFLPRRAAWLGEFQKEVMAFPRGQSDDQVDALSQGLAYVSALRARQCGWGTLIGLH